MRLGQRIAALDIEFVVIDVVQEHIHAGKVVGRVVDLLPEETLFNNMSVKMLLGL